MGIDQVDAVLGDQCGGDALARHVADSKQQLAVRTRSQVIEVPGNFFCRRQQNSEVDIIPPGNLVDVINQQVLLDTSGDGDLAGQ